MKKSPAYFSLSLSIRCRAKLEELEQLTLRSKSSIVEILLMKATLEDVAPELGAGEEGRGPPGGGRQGGPGERWATGKGPARRG